MNIFGLGRRGADRAGAAEHSPAEYHWLEAREAIITAYQFGCCVLEPEPGMRLLVPGIDAVPSPDLIDEMADGFAKPYIAGLNGIKFGIVGHTPFALSLFDPNHIFDFYEDRLSLVVVVDIERVEKALVQVGLIEVSFPNIDGVFCTASNGLEEGDTNRTVLVIGQHFFHRVTVEFPQPTMVHR